jgi:hypothetical protein
MEENQCPARGKECKNCGKQPNPAQTSPKHIQLRIFGLVWYKKFMKTDMEQQLIPRIKSMDEKVESLFKERLKSKSHLS